METWFLDNKDWLRMSCFLGTLALIGLAEAWLPRRERLFTRARRWSANLGLVVLNSVVLRLALPVAAAGMAIHAQDQNWGWLNIVQLPHWLELLLALVLLDFVIWLQHVMAHSIPLFWRLHRVHHADPDFDLTTGARFHPLEILISMLIKFLAIVLIGPSVAAVVLFEIILSSSAMFNHGNLRLPTSLDRILRWILVTPDMHRVHHSVHENETNSNFGFAIPWWDRLFGTYCDQPRDGHTQMRIGTLDCPDQQQATSLPGLLIIPFQGRVEQYAINRRSWSEPPSDET